MAKAKAPEGSQPASRWVLQFDGVDDHLELFQSFPAIEKAITIEFWAEGQSGLECQTSIIAAHNAQNARVVNIHLPWKHVADTRIFWDAGNQEGYDRIDKAVNLEDYNQWAHWAFVKDADSGAMGIYRNGELWHQGQGNHKSLAEVAKFVIGSYMSGSHYWKGLLAEFRIWNRARTQVEIQQAMNSRLSGTEPGLVCYFPLNEGSGETVQDKTASGNHVNITGATWAQAQLHLEEPQGPSGLQSLLKLDGVNAKIKLKSWKGDYLHRPDSDQGVTTWGTGIGNEWIVEAIADNKIHLKSWKGDYLHRPDSDQGVTTWGTGIGNEWEFEVVNAALQFDGQDDYIEIPHNDALDLVNSYTLEAWINPTKLGGRILDKGIGGKTEGFTFDTYQGLRFINHGVVLSSPQVQPGSWRHVAVTFENRTDGARLYINGEQVAVQTPTSQGTSQKTLPMRIGSQADVVGSLFAGQITEVRIWKGVRSQSEIQQTMNQLLTGTEAGLVGYWPLNEVSGTIVQDKTSNANHGTIQGNAVWGLSTLELPTISREHIGRFDMNSSLETKNIQPGKIVVNADEWTLSDTGFTQAPDTVNFVTNIAKWFTAGRSTGKFHAYSTNFGLAESVLAQTMAKTGYAWTVGKAVKFDLPTLLTYDGIFLCGDSVDNQMLIDYVKAGGNVYLAVGALGDAQQEANNWNAFLNAFGLKLLDVYNGISGNQSINSPHPIFAGVKALYQNNGLSIVNLDPASQTTQLLVTHANGQGLIAVAGSDKTTTLTSRPVAFKVSSGQYLVAENGSSGSLLATSDLINTWETFKLITLENGKVALQAPLKREYLSVLPDGNFTWAGQIEEYEMFDLVRMAGSKVALKGHNGKYISIQQGGGGTVIANGSAIQEWEILELIELEGSDILKREKKKDKKGKRKKVETIVLDFGSQKKKAISDFTRGRGRLFKKVSKVISQLHKSGEIDDHAQPVIAIVKQKKSAKKLWDY